MMQEPTPGDIFVRFLDSISHWDSPAVFLREFHAARPPQAGLIFAAFWCQVDVCNGGFWQFFENPTGVMAPEALEAFGAIGLPEWADLLAQAMKFFGEPYPREQDERLEQLDRIPKSMHREEFDPFYHLDLRFYEWLHAEPDRWERAADAYASTIAVD